MFERFTRHRVIVGFPGILHRVVVPHIEPPGLIRFTHTPLLHHLLLAQLTYSCTSFSTSGDMVWAPPVGGFPEGMVLTEWLNPGAGDSLSKGRLVLGPVLAVDYSQRKIPVPGLSVFSRGGFGIPVC